MAAELPPLLTRLPARVEVYEVGPRDGLQNELRSLATSEKVQLIEALVDAGVKRVEVTSFVSPRWIPQLADAADLLAALPRREGVAYSALVPNLKGLERARAAGLEEAAVLVSATESHSKRNLNKSVNEAVAVAREVVLAAAAHGISARCYLSTAWGCPYEGRTPTGRVVDLVGRLADLPLRELSLGDTIGVGTPGHTAELLKAVASVFPIAKLALHLHDTRGTALANALVGLAMGVTVFDASVGGLGGCPYAPGAAGNLATEDLEYMLEGLGIETGIQLPRLVEAGELAQRLIGRRLAGKYLQAALGERDKVGKRTRVPPPPPDPA